jgi:Thioesterase-like superfamily
MELSFFRRSGDSLVPNDIARSMWSDDQMHGVAVSGALARTLEGRVEQEGLAELRASRVTVDLFRPASMDPCRLDAQVVRRGRRICLVHAVLTQGGTNVARASAVFLRPSESAPGEVWAPATRPEAPPLDVVPASDEPRVPFFHSSAGWSQKFSEHRDSSRKASWNTALPVVSGEKVTPFQAAASVADGGSLVTNWGSRGVEYINTDITLNLARMPVGLEIGLEALDRVEDSGIAVGTAAVFDRAGQLGNVIVTSLANARRTVDFEGVEYTDEGERTTRV